MKCSKCNSDDMKNCFQAGQSDPICESCFFNFKEQDKVKFHITYETRNILMNEVDKIHSDMIGVVGGDMLDVDIYDIAFNDDNTAMIIASVKGHQLEGRNLRFLEEYACQTVEEADKNLHKFIQRFVMFRIVNY